MELEDFLITATVTLGLISFFTTLSTFLKWIWRTFLRPAKNLEEYGSWALITGSTDGIGKALAFQLASMNLNLVLVGRDRVKLEKTLTEIYDEYGDNIKVKFIVIDFSKENGPEIVEKIEEGIEGLDVGLVVNNAGFGYPYAKYVHEIDFGLIDSIVKVNIEGATWVTKAVLPVMLKKKKGAIVNIGSGSGSASIVPSYPLYTVYAATKAYMGMFSRSISLEYKKQGIDIQLQMPLLVATKMTSIKKSSFFIPSPEMYSKACVRWIGYEHTCVPYWTHAIECCILRAFPDALVNRFLLGYFLGVRKRGLAKDLKRNNNSVHLS